MRRALFLLTLVASAIVHAADVPDAQKTRAEATYFEETSRAEDVDRVLNGLAAASPNVRVTRFGQSEEGRPLPMAVLASPAVVDAADARRTGRPRVLVLANIHAGEVEGKEAALIIARRLAIGDLRSMLSRVIVIVAPLYNADGNERISLDHRPEQFGPLGGVGTRENANGLDLNRDFTKLEATESRALVKLLNDWDPHLVIDLHTTNGSYHGYHLTYAPTLAVGADPRIVSFTRDTLLGGATQSWPTAAGARTSTATSRSRGSLDASRSGRRVPAAARRRGARSMQGRGSSPTASAFGIASACSPRRTATCRSSAASK